LIEVGILAPQDGVSMIAVEIVPLSSEVRATADLCAAPGNKTSYLAELSGLKVKIHALDVNKDRIKRMRRLLERTGTMNTVVIHHMDARKAVDLLGENTMDLVMVDPPCSSTGALARNPDVRWKYSVDQLAEINELQKQLLETAIHLVEKDRYVIYTTCSILPSEGEHVVEHVLDKYGSQVEVVSLEKPFKKSLVLEGTMRSFPHIHRVTGFFYTLLKKTMK